MKTTLHFLFTCLVSFFALCGALGAKENPWPGFAVAFGIWIIFFWRVSIRNKREAERRQYEQYMFTEYMRWRSEANR